MRKKLGRHQRINPEHDPEVGFAEVVALRDTLKNLNSILVSFADVKAIMQRLIEHRYFSTNWHTVQMLVSDLAQYDYAEAELHRLRYRDCNTSSVSYEMSSQAICYLIIENSIKRLIAQKEFCFLCEQLVDIYKKLAATYAKLSHELLPRLINIVPENCGLLFGFTCPDASSVRGRVVDAFHEFLNKISSQLPRAYSIRLISGVFLARDFSGSINAVNLCLQAMLLLGEAIPVSLGGSVLSPRLKIDFWLLHYHELIMKKNNYYAEWLGRLGTYYSEKILWRERQIIRCQAIQRQVVGVLSPSSLASDATTIESSPEMLGRFPVKNSSIFFEVQLQYGEAEVEDVASLDERARINPR